MLIAEFREVESTALTYAALTWILSFVKICQRIQKCKQDGASHYCFQRGEQDKKNVSYPQLISAHTVPKTSPIQY